MYIFTNKKQPTNMKKNSWSILSIILLSAAFTSCQNSTESVDLKFNFQPGSKYQYTMNTHTTVLQQAMGMSMKVGQDMTLVSTYDMMGNDGQNKKMNITYNRIAMKIDNNAMPMQYDSDDTAHQDSMLKGLSGMLNKPFNATISDQGEVINVSGLTEILGSLTDSTQPNAQKNKMMLSQQMNDSSVKSSLQQSFNVYPGHPVKVGDTWKRTISSPMSNVIMKVESDYKLTSVKNGIATIDVNSKLTSVASANPAMKELKIDLTGTQKGTSEIEVSSGLMTNSTMKMTIKGKISITGTEIPMSMEGTTTLKGIKK
jgi:hypothetical protein